VRELKLKDDVIHAFSEELKKGRYEPRRDKNTKQLYALQKASYLGVDLRRFRKGTGPKSIRDKTVAEEVMQIFREYVALRQTMKETEAFFGLDFEEMRKVLRTLIEEEAAH